MYPLNTEPPRTEVLATLIIPIAKEDPVDAEHLESLPMGKEALINLPLYTKRILQSVFTEILETPNPSMHKDHVELLFDEVDSLCDMYFEISPHNTEELEDDIGEGMTTADAKYNDVYKVVNRAHEAVAFHYSDAIASVIEMKTAHFNDSFDVEIKEHTDRFYQVTITRSF